ncbi:PEP-CTERM sorting domain-containing protein [Cerasicoccus fimbriatus]|uniref:PEP-CTERM sorting domain-containing protein n=1 Tax=Cerasicoccus fimbriatus TaxID=3014554 RepID=UPI0022B59E4A|nr:PEP-CTERM sorting domain-containing protein [Cerasicoccus sp. TK19100]
MTGAAVSASAFTTVFSDGDFDPIWNTVMPTNGTTTDPDAGGGGSQTTSVSATGGNPGAFLDILLNIGSSNRIVGTFSWRDDFTIDPAAVGGITNISYSFDAKRGASNNPGNAQAFGMAIEQNGIHYYSYNANSLTDWNNYSDSDFTIGELAVYPGEQDEAAAGGFETPDFSASGAPITFGYMRLNSTVGAAAFIHGFMDNYSVTVDHVLVPEPSTYALALGAVMLVGVVVRRRR